jgi:hypothetical protein
MRIVLDKRREHGTSDVSVMLIDVHKHGDPRPLDQRAHSLSFCSQALSQYLLRHRPVLLNHDDAQTRPLLVARYCLSDD